MNPAQTALLKEVETYLARHNVSATAFGVRAVNNWKLVKKLRSGESITMKTFDRVRAFLDKEKRR